jgi:hypothetical protein
MRARAAIPGMLVFVLLALAANVLAGIVVLKTGYRIQGRILREDAQAVVVGYGDGWLKIPKLYVDRIVKVRELSEYGRQGLAPSEGELLSVEEAIIGPLASAEAAREGPGQALDLAEMVTARHALESGKLAFAFELPLSWTAKKAGNAAVFAPAGEGPRPCASAVVLETPGVKPEEQLELTEAAMKTELGGFRLIYACTRAAAPDGACFSILAGTYGPQNAGFVAKTVLRRTPTHTLAITFFIPVQLYSRYRSLPGACENGIEVRESGK